ncbi:serine/threonine-protein kinase [Angustibacter luteus]|uniref:non-specific serine/threonine protein kinase n=1 Tax=Angustibacter luteus TaxID=658456 RepID=A0ABW1JDT3_9ACTN
MTELLADRYLLVERLGRGAMGEVWSATDAVLGRTVAVKLMLRTGDGEQAAGRFRVEAQAAARLSHPNVVTVHDFGTSGDHGFLVMELVAGHDLARETALNGAMAPERAMTVVAQAAAGLAAAHAQGVIHRDVKPGNLLLAADGTVKVADFGIARLVDDPALALTSTGEILGTSHYLAPERAQGGPATSASDVYSLGCVLYQLVTGVTPFRADSPAGVAYQHVQAVPVRPGQVLPELMGSPVEALTLRLLAKDPAMRPSAAEIAAWTSSTDQAPVLPPPTAVLPPIVTEPAPAGGRSRRPAALVGAATVAVAGVVAVAVGLGGNDPAASVDRPTVSASPRPAAATSTRTTHSPSPTATRTRATNASTTTKVKPAPKPAAKPHKAKAPKPPKHPAKKP